SISRQNRPPTLPLSLPTRRSSDLPPDGVTLNTTGALVPRARVHVLVRVNGPNTLLSPAVNVVVTVMVDIPPQHAGQRCRRCHRLDRKSTRLNSSHVSISYAVFCLK